MNEKQNDSEHPSPDCMNKKLIHLVKGIPEIWNRKHAFYSCEPIVEIAWVSIGKNLGVKPEDARWQWDNLRELYRCWVMKIPCICRETGHPDAHEPHWKPYSSMSFLKNQIVKENNSKPTIDSRVPRTILAEPGVPDPEASHLPQPGPAGGEGGDPQERQQLHQEPGGAAPGSACRQGKPADPPQEEQEGRPLPLLRLQAEKVQCIPIRPAEPGVRDPKASHLPQPGPAGGKGGDPQVRHQVQQKPRGAAAGSVRRQGKATAPRRKEQEGRHFRRLPLLRLQAKPGVRDPEASHLPQPGPAGGKGGDPQVRHQLQRKPRGAAAGSVRRQGKPAAPRRKEQEGRHCRRLPLLRLQAEPGVRGPKALHLPQPGQAGGEGGDPQARHRLHRGPGGAIPGSARGQGQAAAPHREELEEPQQRLLLLLFRIHAELGVNNVEVSYQPQPGPAGGEGGNPQERHQLHGEPGGDAPGSARRQGKAAAPLREEQEGRPLPLLGLLGDGVHVKQEADIVGDNASSANSPPPGTVQQGTRHSREDSGEEQQQASCKRLRSGSDVGPGTEQEPDLQFLMTFLPILSRLPDKTKLEFKLKLLTQLLGSLQEQLRKDVDQREPLLKVLAEAEREIKDLAGKEHEIKDLAARDQFRQNLAHLDQYIKDVIQTDRALMERAEKYLHPQKCAPNE